MVHDRFGVTICGKRGDVLRALAALETATRHDPRPVPLVRLGQGDYTRDFTPQAISAPGGETKDRAQVTEG